MEIVSQNNKAQAAFDATNEGLMIGRAGWHGKNMFGFKQVPSIIHKDIVPKMTSLPQAVKDEFVRRFNDDSTQIDSIYYLNQLAIVNTSNLVQGWSPSVADVLAEDWIIYK
jgi:hypothetical protein